MPINSCAPMLAAMKAILVAQKGTECLDVRKSCLVRIRRFTNVPTAMTTMKYANRMQ